MPSLASTGSTVLRCACGCGVGKQRQSLERERMWKEPVFAQSGRELGVAGGRKRGGVGVRRRGEGRVTKRVQVRGGCHGQGKQAGGCSLVGALALAKLSPTSKSRRQVGFQGNERQRNPLEGGYSPRKTREYVQLVRTVCESARSQGRRDSLSKTAQPVPHPHTRKVRRFDACAAGGWTTPNLSGASLRGCTSPPSTATAGRLSRGTGSPQRITGITRGRQGNT